jgi:hypothetical protein
MRDTASTRRTRPDAHTRTTRAAGLLVAATLAALPLGAPPVGAQPVAAASAAPRVAVESLPFGVGERLTYRTRVAKLGYVGSGAMWIEGPVEVRGQATYRLRFDFDTRVGIVRVVNRTESWLDPAQMRSLRFHKHERHPLSSHDQRVELRPEAHRWEDAAGAGGTLDTDAPLDELSYLYFLRTLPLVPDSTYRFDRHFEAGRNPTTIHVLGRETVETPAGTYRTLVVEMRVRDARRYRGEGVLRINLSDDHCRIPVRIQTRMPVVGAAVLTLEAHVSAHGATQHGATPHGALPAALTARAP